MKSLITMTDRRRSITHFIFLSISACILIFAACEGPAGPEGPQGPQGSSGEQGPQGEQGPEGERGPAGEEGNANVTLYIFDAPVFTETNNTHTVAIDNLSRTEAMESAWNFAFIRGAQKLFFPGKLTEGDPPYEFAVQLFFDNDTETLEIRIEFLGGGVNGEYYPDQIHVIRTVPSNIVSSKSIASVNEHLSSLKLEKPNFPNYNAFIEFYGKENITVIDNSSE